MYYFIAISFRPETNPSLLLYLLLFLTFLVWNECASEQALNQQVNIIAHIWVVIFSQIQHLNLFGMRESNSYIIIFYRCISLNVEIQLIIPSIVMN